MRDAVVIGAGFSGLVTAIRLAKAGRTVTLLTKGIGGIQLGQGTIDIFGYNPDRVTDPLAAVDAITDGGHPYAHFSGTEVAAAVRYLAELLPDVFVGDPARNVLLPTAVGALRPTALVPTSMAAGEVTDGKKYLIVGLARLKDFYPGLVAENLGRTPLPGGGSVTARAVTVDFVAREGEADSTGLNHARALDDPDNRRKLVALVKPHLAEGEVVGLPAVLGIHDTAAWTDIQTQLGVPVFEIPLPPPGVPGMRINEALTRLAKDAGVRVIVGNRVVDHAADGTTLTGVVVNSAGSKTGHAAKAVVIATGGFESGNLHMDSYGTVTEKTFGLPLANAEAPLVHGDYWGADQPLFKVGVAVDDAMRVVGSDGAPVFGNLYAAGGILAGATRWREKSGEGIALASAVRAADSILGEAR
ncbi:glycerol-3-phosphate dehydrogenase subunit GlpB [Propionicicella superfundia]|uniref:glycerol-3-phosphate dehydrogenase subunit GlpB n=1 Tax=Propionicicella superfundia TaxID=348582 RepID=UPI00041995D0|nr:glycerol-3-phosphate dehydrogenase subunit GlpB [Propionicicella superfundia]